MPPVTTADEALVPADEPARDATGEAAGEAVGEAVGDALVHDALLHDAGTHRKGVLRWGYFLLLNAIAGVIAVGFFVAVLFADGIDPYLVGTYEWLLDHPGVTSLAAFSPLACSLLVGYGYGMRARKRRLAAEKAAASLPPVAKQTA